MKLELIRATGSRKNRRILTTCKFTDEVTNVLAKHIAKISEYKDCEIISMGPFGLGANCIVCVKKDGEYLGSLTVTYAPGYDFGKFEYIDYEAPQKNTYPKDSIGDMNGFNYQTHSLPTDIEEVMKLVFKKGA